MTPPTAAVTDVGNGIQNKKPLLGQQIQPKLRSPVRVHGDRVQNGLAEAFVHVPAGQSADVCLHIGFQRGRFKVKLLPFPGGLQTRRNSAI